MIMYKSLLNCNNTGDTEMGNEWLGKQDTLRKYAWLPHEHCKVCSEPGQWGNKRRQ